MGLLGKLSGKDAKGGNALCIVFGSDKRFVRRMMELQGAHIQDNEHRMAYFSSPNSNGVLSRKKNGVERTQGPVSVAYEPIPELYSFPSLDWATDRNAEDKTSDNGHRLTYEPDEILDNSWAEGHSLAGQRQDNSETRNRLMQILLLAVLGTVAMFLLVASSTGLLSDFIEGAKGFFGGG